MTELDCLQYTKEKGLYNPLYDKFNRLGCRKKIQKRRM